jgi:lysozyme
MANMTTGQAGLKLIESFEGLRLTAYWDNHVPPILTVGFGHTGSDVSEGMTITQDQAEAYLQQDLATAEGTINTDVTVALNQNQFDALVSLVYNIGSGNFRSSTLLKVLNQGEYDQVPAQFMRWDQSGGQVNPGLQRRRQAESDLFSTASTDTSTDNSTGSTDSSTDSSNGSSGGLLGSIESII